MKQSLPLKSKQTLEFDPAISYGIDTFCERADIGRTMVYSEIRKGRLKAVKCGKRTLIPYKAALAWLELLSQETDHA